MATNLSSMRTYLRTLLFDTGATQAYTNTEIDNFLRIGFWVFNIDTNSGYDLDSLDSITPTMETKHQVLISLASMIQVTRGKIAKNEFLTSKSFKDGDKAGEWSMSPGVLRDFLSQLTDDYLRLIAMDSRRAFTGTIIQTSFNTSEASLRYSSTALGAIVG